jgi:hypothetical protein
LDKPAEGRKEGELVSVLGEAKRVNNIVEEGTKMRTVYKRTLRLSE